MKKLILSIALVGGLCSVGSLVGNNAAISHETQQEQGSEEKPAFTSQKLTDNTFAIFGNGATAYLLLGEREAIMIDAGMNRENIRAYAQSLTTLPLRAVINTHSHFDHTAGNGFFDTVYATEGISRSAKNTMGNPFEYYQLDYAFTIIGDGEVIDVGNRRLQIIELDCHSPGNVAILDLTYGMLFPGDELETGQVLLLPGYAEKPGQLHAAPAATVERYLAAMKKLAVYRDQIKAIYPGHNGTPIATDYLDRYIELAQRVFSGELEGKQDCSNGSSYNNRMSHFPYENANYRRAEWRGASLIYCADLIRNADYSKDPVQKAPATALHEQSANSIYR